MLLVRMGQNLQGVLIISQPYHEMIKNILYFIIWPDLGKEVEPKTFLDLLVACTVPI